MTKAKLNELNFELEKLKSKRPAAASEVARLAELGDFSENAEYQLAKGRLRGINNAILRLDSQINNAEVIDLKSGGNTVQIGSRVSVEVKGREKTFQILGSVESNPQIGVISYLSPLGHALFGHKAGETVVFKIASGEASYRILAIN
ncbi:MAG: GreA/GreB family elongation factor [Candidatus Magasanikbacteria bacterium]|nr:GreA/GreB family elongation factor [Candidatus Magasanikbacteria bacterium]